MNPFRNSKVPHRVDEMLDIAFGRAFRRLPPLKKRRDLVEAIRNREIARIQTITDTITSRLDAVVKTFPSLERVHPFYRELLDIIAGIDRTKHSLGAVQWAGNVIRRLAASYIRRLGREDEPERMARLRREFQGRISSILRRIEPEIDHLVESIPKLRKLPDIAFDVPTVVIAGMPNTGKSTLLSKLSTKRPEIAPYPFTTKGVIIGHGHLNGIGRVQYIDTPGLLDRPLEERNRIELQAIIALKHLKGPILYVSDPTETCGYSMDEQLSLLKEIEGRFGSEVLVVLNKADLKGEYREKFEAFRTKLDDIGYPSVEVSAETGIGMNKLRVKVRELLTKVIDLEEKGVSASRRS